jgi:IclR family KDG regulon transcriptional repressor
MEYAVGWYDGGSAMSVRPAIEAHRSEEQQLVTPGRAKARRVKPAIVRPIESVEQALRVLDILAGAAELGVSELAAMLGRSPSGAFRLLATLQANGFVYQVPASRKYRLGLKLFELSARQTRGYDLGSLARPYLEELVQRTGETARLEVLDRGESVTISLVESDHAVQIRASLGQRSAAYATSTGKVQLAFQPADLIERVVEAGLTPHTPHTVTDRDALLKELAEIRRRGYATNVSGWREGAAGVAAPVRNAGNLVVAAIGIAGPASRLSSARLKALATDVGQTADSVSQQLGWAPAGAAEPPSQLGMERTPRKR